MVRLGKGSVSQVIEWLKCWGKDPAQRIEAFRIWAHDVQWTVQGWEIKELEGSATEDEVVGVVPPPPLRQLDSDSVSQVIQWLKCWGKDPGERLEAFTVWAECVQWQIQGWEITQLRKSPTEGEKVEPTGSDPKTGGKGGGPPGKGGDGPERSSVKSG